MVNSMVGRATSDMLIGPDWAMNIEICDICNHDPVQAKDVVKGIKKRLGSRNPKVQLLALTLLETIVKNCGDFVHMHVAEKGLLNDMVKICKKRPEFHVKEKILVLIDTWQEAFGGARARYPQYYAAYHELLRLGAVFPQKSKERSTPVLTPPQTQPISSYPENNTRHLENENGAATSSVESEFPTLSLTEMQNARGIMDVLSEMLTAVDPEKKEGLRQEVIVDLVEQCRTYKRRVVHLVNSTSDESLLCQGLALNDDLQRVLNKHESLLTGIPIPSEKSKAESSQTKALVPVNAPLINTTETKQKESVNGGLDLISLAPITTTNGTTSTSTALVKFDLLSGDDYNSPTAGNSLAIVPVGSPQPATPVSQQNALALVLANNNSQNMSPAQMYSSPQMQHPQNMPPQQGGFYQNGNNGYSQGLNPMWNGQMSQQQQNSSGFGVTSGGGMPPPPWEAQTTDNQNGGPQYSQPQNLQTSANYNNMNMNMNQQQHLGSQMPQMNQQPVYNNQFPQQQYVMPHQQMPYINPQQMAQQMYNNQIAQQMAQQMYNNQMAQQAYGYGYNQQQSAQYIDQRMAGMSMRDNSYSNSTVYTGPSMANASYVHMPSGKPTKAEDKLFGDLVDFSKVKPKTTPGRTSM